MNNLISLIPLSYNSSIEEINRLLDQVNQFGEDLNIIVILEKEDYVGFSNWLIATDHYKNRYNFVIEKLIKNKSKGACLNRAVELCKTKYYMRTDMDDYNYPFRLIDTKKFIENSEEIVDLIYSDIIENNSLRLIRYPTPSFIPLVSAFKNPIAAPTVCIRKNYLIEKNITYPLLNRCEDLSLFLKFVDNKANILKLPRPVVEYKNNNLFKRDYKNWIINSKVRFKRDRYDWIGYLSFLMAFVILFYGLFMLSILKIKKIANLLFKYF